MLRIREVSSNTVCRGFRPAYRVFISFLFFAALIPVASAEPGGNDYPSLLLSRAREQSLHEQRYWDILLHYAPSGQGKESLIDDRRFFLAPEGKRDPAAELAATLQGFFQDPAQGDDHPQCRFAGRYAWLAQELAIDETLLPRPLCGKLRDALTLIDPRSTVLIFPATHNNSPTSMFGHTLIRIDGAARNDLLAFAINYAAIPDDKIGFLYAFKGIVGMYPGYYSILPYYEKVKEYTALEHRDMWEFRLNLTEEETRRMVLHIWEMQNIHADYYFFDENCSYGLLFLLEAARPSVHLTDRVGKGAGFWVIPTDTIRAIRENGLIESVRFRPSQATKIEVLSSIISADLRDLALNIGRGTTAPEAVAGTGASTEDRMRVLDLSAEYLQYRASKREIDQAAYLKRFIPVLQARSALGRSPESLYRVPEPGRPDEGHLPAKFILGGGCRTGSCFGELGWRPAYHDIMENDKGYVAGSQINFFQVLARYDADRRHLRLQSIRPIDIVSLAPWNRFFHPVSWKVATGIEQRTLPGGRERLAGFVNGGAGLAARLGTGIAYLFADGGLDAGGAYDDHYALSAGGSAGALITIIDRWKIHVALQATAPAAGDPYRSVRGEVSQSFTVNKANALMVTASRDKTGGQYRSETKAVWQFYY